jgi:enoyl-CoA hydratase
LRFQTYDELERAVRSATGRCLVITGADPAFCSGDDVRQIMGGGESTHVVNVEPRLTPAADALLRSDIPVVAAVNGAAVGWGMELSLMADIRVASERAKFGELFVLRGLCTDVAGIARLANAVGRERAAELLFTGEIVDAAMAKDMGLVSRVVPHDELLPTAMEVASRIAANPPLAVQKIKEGLRRALDPDWTSLGTWVATSLTELFKTEDHREGVKAFLEKRQPNYVGR